MLPEEKFPGSWSLGAVPKGGPYPKKKTRSQRTALAGINNPASNLNQGEIAQQNVVMHHSASHFRTRRVTKARCHYVHVVAMSPKQMISTRYTSTLLVRYCVDRSSHGLSPQKLENYIAFGKSTSQRIYPKQHTPKIGQKLDKCSLKHALHILEGHFR